jgi:hypothetical protein
MAVWDIGSVLRDEVGNASRHAWATLMDGGSVVGFSSADALYERRTEKDKLFYVRWELRGEYEGVQHHKTDQQRRFFTRFRVGVVDAVTGHPPSVRVRGIPSACFLLIWSLSTA